MNYRRGLQRMYAVFAVVWIVAVLTVSFRDRPESVSVFDSSDLSSAPPTLPAGWSFADKADNKKDTKPSPWSDYQSQTPPPPPSGYTLENIASETPVPGVRLHYWELHSAVAVLPPDCSTCSCSLSSLGSTVDLDRRGYLLSVKSLISMALTSARRSCSSLRSLTLEIDACPEALLASVKTIRESGGAINIALPIGPARTMILSSVLSIEYISI